MASSRVRIFLCSTYSDLIAEREAALDAMARLELQHQSMEHFGARSQKPIEACLQEVSRSNIVVVIVGHKYGSLVPGKSISFTEAEYREAIRLKKYLLVYLKRDDVPVLPRDFERDAKKIERFDAFSAQLKENHTVARFRSAPELALSVSDDVTETIELIEKQSLQAANDDDIFVSELSRIAREALASGVGEAALLSSFKGAIADLRSATAGSPRNLGAIVRDALVSIQLWKPRRKKPWVFLSYAHADAGIVAAVAGALEHYDVRVWLDQQELRVGDNLFDEIRSGLSKADAFVFFASERSIQSRWVTHELEYVASRRITQEGSSLVIPVVLDDVRLPAYLRDVLFIDLRNGDVNRAARLIAAAVHNVSPDSLAGNGTRSRV